MSKELIYTRGLPGSSKSSWAKQFVLDNPNWKRINMDELRLMFDNKLVLPKADEKFMKKMRDILLIEALKEGKNVISDACHLSPRSVEHIKQLVHKYNKDNNDNVRVTEKSFLDVPVEECIKRDLARPNSVGSRVIMDMYEQFIEKKCEPLVQNSDLKRSYLVDLDGTVCIMKNRSPYDWAKVGEDLPNTPIVNIIKNLWSVGFQIIFFSGRDEICRQETIDWLNTYFGKNFSTTTVSGGHVVEPYLLYMRPQGDNRKDSIVKKEMFDKYIRDKFFIEAVFDDRNSVVSTWRKEIGLTCLQVAEGNF